MSAGDVGGIDLAEHCRVVQEIAREAGALIVQGFNSTQAQQQENMEFKGDAGLMVDIVTETDKQVEAFVKQRLAAAFPGYAFLGEEEATDGGGEHLGDSATWVVDPIDGTTNFVHRVAMFSVSIALAVGRKAVLGVVYNPLTDDMHHAYRGGGAFRNDEAIHVSKKQSLKEAIVQTNVGYDRSAQGIAHMMGNITTLLDNNIRGIRMNGSAALEMCNVACGRMDAFYEFGIHSWDIAAACCIVEEAGGLAVDMDGSELDLVVRRVLCGNPAIVKELSGLIKFKPYEE